MALSRREVIDHIIDVYGGFNGAASKSGFVLDATGWCFWEEIGCFHSGNDDPIFFHDIHLKTIIQRDLAGFSYWDNAWWRTC